jgi:hypothetical protein
MMTRIALALALAALPLAAEAASFSVKNCSADALTVSGFPATPINADASSTGLAGANGGTVAVSCPGTACRVQIIYPGPGPGQASIATFGNATYDSDRCTRGIADRGAGPLPAAGTCGC